MRKKRLISILGMMSICGIGIPIIAQAAEHPLIEEIDWSFRNTVRYEKPVAAFDYTNNSDYTIVELDIEFRIKENVTAEELNVIEITGEQVSDEEIVTLKPFVYDRIVCDPEETAENASCYITYNVEPTSTEQSDLMELHTATIYYIGKDSKKHMVKYSAENDGYAMAETTEELYIWEECEFSQMIPKPDTRIASGEMYDENTFWGKAYDISQEYFLEYINACEQMGFIDDYPNDDSTYNYFGTHESGRKIHLRFLDTMNYMEVEVENEEE